MVENKEIDILLQKKFPKNMYNHNVDFYLTCDSGYSQLCVGNISETEDISNYLKELGADEVYVEQIRNEWGKYDSIIFHMKGNNKRFDYKTSK